MLKTWKINKRILRTGVRRLLFLLAGLLAAAGGYGGYRAMMPQMQLMVETLYSYQLSADCSYTVYLKPNELYTEKTLAEERLYSNNLIDHFEIIFEAQYAGDMDVSVNGDYAIEAVVQGYQGGSENRQVIYARHFPLVAQTSVNGDGQVSVSQQVSVTLPSYIEFADKAEQILGSRTQRELLLLFTGCFVAESTSGKVEAPFSHTMTMPLTSELFSITKQEPYSMQNSHTKTEEYAVLASPTHLDLAPWVILALVSLALALAVLLFTRKPTLEEQSHMGIKEMIRKHGSRMVRLSAPPNLAADKTQTAVLALEDLLKLSDEIHRPICYFPDTDGLPADNLLYVTDSEHHYTLCYRPFYHYYFRGTCTDHKK